METDTQTNQAPGAPQPVAKKIPTLAERTKAAREANLKAAVDAGQREGLQDNQVRLPGGEILTFGELCVFDQLEMSKEAGMPLQELVVRDSFRYSALAAWRSAVAGGYDMPFTAFSKLLTMAKFNEVLAVAQPFLGKSVPSLQSGS
ncbi:MAG: hypothetical protein HQ519_00080 [Planctomycetes bacterium]|nr:hypothetical protein [Planctomycetota bacterium]